MKINGEKVNLVDDLYGEMIWKKSIKSLSVQHMKI